MAEGPSQFGAVGHPAGPVSIVLPENCVVASPEAVGLNGASLGMLGEYLTSFAGANVHSVLVIRHGTLVYEQYFTGDDEIWSEPTGPISFQYDTKHDLRSITKSVTGLLVGIAIGRNLIDGVDEPVFKFFPEHADLRTPEKDRILLRHLLTMSAGLEWDQFSFPYSNPANSESAMAVAPDPCRFVLGLPVETPAGKNFRYSSGAAELLGAVIRKVTGQSIEDFARDALFAPLGIADTNWIRFPDSGIALAYGGLRLRPRDMAKLGQLLLTRGKWNGQQVVPPEWIADSMLPQIGDPCGQLFYSYQWWLGRSLLNKKEVPWVMGNGFGGQRIFVVPAFDLVMVITAGLYASSMQQWLPEELLNRYVLAAIKEL
jgi:CubicO group peptidase (beta-lactamase class C family)